MAAKQPHQPLTVDATGTVCFQENQLVQFCIESGLVNMNMLMALPNISNADRMQFAQLIGYTFGGFAELPYVDDETLALLGIQATAVAAYNRRTHEPSK